MKGLFAAAMLVFIVQGLYAFEPDMLNLTVPSELTKTEAVFRIQHRFYGTITDEPLETFFGLDAGANVSLGLRYALISRLELKASYTRFEKEYVVGASYAYMFPRLSMKTQADVQFFSYQTPGIEERRTNFFYSLSLQSEPLAHVLAPTINCGYDGYNETFGIGAGIDLSFDVRVDPVKKMSVIGEYYPVISRDAEIHGPENCFSAGVKLETYGHHFMLLVSNNSHIGVRRLMLGTATNDLYFGFTVHRIIDL